MSIQCQSSANSRTLSCQPIPVPICVNRVPIQPNPWEVNCSNLMPILCQSASIRCQSKPIQGQPIANRFESDVNPVSIGVNQVPICINLVPIQRRSEDIQLSTDSNSKPILCQSRPNPVPIHRQSGPIRSQSQQIWCQSISNPKTVH